jgi:proline iminopeptidase
MRSLYPEIEPRYSDYVQVDDIHRVYFEESGHPDGIPIIFLHGGPGLGSNENHRRYFNPDRYRIINFDQRGCHRSSPRGEVLNNTTQDLIEDIEAIRNATGIDKWIIFGGSWGATLGLLYAQRYPRCVIGMILRGTFLARPRDVDWLLRDGAKSIFPDAWERFESFIPADERHDLVSAYYQRMLASDRSIVEKAARHWSDWTGRVVTYLLDIEEYMTPADLTDVIHEVRIETHYTSHHYFIEEDQILSDIEKIPRVPIKIIHGRRDLTCPLEASWSLHRSLPESELVIVNTGGHLAGEPVMIDALITATDDMARRLG